MCGWHARRAAQNGERTYCVTVADGASARYAGSVCAGERRGCKRGTTRRGITPLTWASYRGDFDCVKFPVANGADINAKANVGDTALFEASMGGSVDCVRFLIGRGANINAKSGGYTALMKAEMKQHPDWLRALIAAHADLNAKDIKGDTALSLAGADCGPKINAILKAAVRRKMRHKSVGDW